MTYPKKEEEKLIIRMNNSGTFPKASAVLQPEDIVKAREVVREVYMDEKIERYIVDIIYATRTPSDYGLKSLTDMISYGASPRASKGLRLHQAPRLRDTRGREGRLLRGAPSPYRPDLRG